VTGCAAAGAGVGAIATGAGAGAGAGAVATGFGGATTGLAGCFGEELQADNIPKVTNNAAEVLLLNKVIGESFAQIELRYLRLANGTNFRFSGPT
jgi:hypothetical protein